MRSQKPIIQLIYKPQQKVVINLSMGLPIFPPFFMTNFSKRGKITYCR